jgi:uncharacterized membrane protein YraQ (UPF0718 family)
VCCPNGLTAYKVEGTLVDRTVETVTIRDRAGATQEIPASLMQGVEEVRKNRLYELIYHLRWALVLVLLAAFVYMVGSWFNREELREWVEATWGFAQQILPLLLIGVLVSGFLLGRPGPGHEGIIPSAWVNAAVGGNSLRANLFASVAGAFMYFATLTEVPIVQGLMGAGMGKGPALALLLAGPALSLPSILVIRSVIGTRKTLVYITLVVIMATVSGILFGSFF